MTAAPRASLLGFAILVSFAAITALPIFGIVLLSLQPEQVQLSGFEWPDRLHFENYARAFETAHFADYLRSSLIVSVAVVAGTVVVSTKKARPPTSTRERSPSAPTYASATAASPGKARRWWSGCGSPAGIAAASPTTSRSTPLGG